MFDLMPFGRTRSMDAFDPFRSFDEMTRSFFGDNEPGLFRTDVRDTGDAYLVEADLPGVKKEDIHVDIDGDRLTISAQRGGSREERAQDGSYIRCERSYGTFSRSFDISGVQADHIAAAYENGVLTLTMPKKEAAVPAARRLEIQ